MQGFIGCRKVSPHFVQGFIQFFAFDRLRKSSKAAKPRKTNGNCSFCGPAHNCCERLWGAFLAIWSRQEAHQLSVGGEPTGPGADDCSTGGCRQGGGGGGARAPIVRTIGSMPGWSGSDLLVTSPPGMRYVIMRYHTARSGRLFLSPGRSGSDLLVTSRPGVIPHGISRTHIHLMGSRWEGWGGRIHWAFIGLTMEQFHTFHAAACVRACSVEYAGPVWVGPAGHQPPQAITSCRGGLGRTCWSPTVPGTHVYAYTYISRHSHRGAGAHAGAAWVGPAGHQPPGGAI